MIPAWSNKKLFEFSKGNITKNLKFQVWSLSIKNRWRWNYPNFTILMHWCVFWIHFFFKVQELLKRINILNGNKSTWKKHFRCKDEDSDKDFLFNYWKKKSQKMLNKSHLMVKTLTIKKKKAKINSFKDKAKEKICPEV